jgi:hypothetical protein
MQVFVFVWVERSETFAYLNNLIIFRVL